MYFCPVRMRVYTYLINSMWMCSVVLDAWTGIGPYGDSLSFTFTVDQRKPREWWKIDQTNYINDIIGFNWATRKVQSGQRFRSVFFWQSPEWLNICWLSMALCYRSVSTQPAVRQLRHRLDPVSCLHPPLCVCVCSVLCAYVHATVRHCFASRPVRKGNSVPSTGV